MLTLDATHFKHVHVRNHTDTQSHTHLWAVAVLTIARLYLSGRRSRGRDYHISRRTRHELQAHHGHVTILNRPACGTRLGV